MKLLAPAKLNLGLRIVGKRPDSYHLLESIFWPIGLFDEISIKPTDKASSVSMRWTAESPWASDPFPAERDNLVFKALKNPLIGRSYSIDIIKSIPMGGGLGGGSSDVGTFLRWAREEKVLDSDEAKKLALHLGADVPFFLDPRPAWVTGIGEKIQKLHLAPSFPQLAVWLIFPPEGTQTGEVFRRYASSNTAFSPSTSCPMDISSVKSLQALLHSVGNDLEAAAVQTLPLIGKILEPLRRTQNVYAGMTGSGSTCFALFESPELREETAKVLLPIYRSLHCRSLFVETL